MINLTLNKKLLGTTALAITLLGGATKSCHAAAFSSAHSEYAEELRKKGTKHRVKVETDRVKTEYKFGSHATPPSPEKATDDAAELLRRNKAVKAELARLQAEAAEKEALNKKEIERLSSELRDKESRLGMAKQQYDAVTRDLAVSQQALIDAEAKRKALDAQYLNLRGSVAYAENMLRSKERMLKEKIAVLVDLESKLKEAGLGDSALRADVEAAKMAKKLAQAAYDKGQEEKLKAEQNLADAQSQKEKLSQKLDAEIKARQQQIEGHTASLAKLQTALQEAQADSDAVRQDMGVLEGVLGETQQQILTLETRLAQGQSHLQALHEYLLGTDDGGAYFGEGLTSDALGAFRLDQWVEAIMSGLDAQSRNHKRNVGLLQAELSELRTLRASEAKAAEDVTNQVEKLKAQIQKKEENLRLVEEKLAVSQNKEKQLAAAKLALVADLEKVKADLQQEQVRHTETQAKLTAVEAKQAQVSGELEDCQRAASLAVGRSAALEAELAVLKEAATKEGADAVAAHDAAMASLKAKVAEEAQVWAEEKAALHNRMKEEALAHQKRIDMLQLNLDEQEAKLKKSIAQIAILDAENGENLQQIEKLQAEVVELDSARRKAEIALQNVEAQHQAKVQAFMDLEDKSKAQEQALADQRHALAKITAEKTELSEHLEAAERKKTKITANLHKAEGDQRRLTAELTELQKFIAEKVVAFEAAQQTAAEEGAQVEEEVSATRAQYQEARAQYQASQEKVAALSKELSRLVAELDKAEAHHADLKSQAQGDAQAIKEAAAREQELRDALDTARSDYTQRKQAYEVEKAELDESLAALRAALSLQEMASNENEFELLALQAQLDQARTELQDAAQTAQAQRDALRVATTSVERLKEQLEEAKAQLQAREASLQDLSHQLTTLTSEREKVESTLVDLQVQQAQAQERINAFALDAAEMRGTIDSLRAMNAKQSDLIEFTNAEQLVLRNEIAEMEAEKSTLDARYKALEAKHKDALQRLEKTTFQIQSLLPSEEAVADPELDDVILRLRTYMVHIKKEAEAHEAAKSQLDVLMTDLQRDMGQLHTALSKAREEKEQVEAKQKALEKEVAAQHEEIDALSAELRGQRSNLSDVEAERDALSDDVLGLRNEVEKLKDRVELLRLQKVAKEDRIKDLEAAQLEKDRELAAFEKNVRRLTLSHNSSMHDLEIAERVAAEDEAFLGEIVQDQQSAMSAAQTLSQELDSAQEQIQVLKAMLDEAGRQGLSALNATETERQAKNKALLSRDVAARELAAVEAKVSLLTKEKESLEATLPALQDQIMKQKQRKTQMEASIDELRTKLTKAEGESTNAQARLKTLKAEKASAQAQLQREQASHQAVVQQLARVNEQLKTSESGRERSLSDAHKATLEAKKYKALAESAERDAGILRKAFAAKNTGTSEYRDSFGGANAADDDDSILRTPVSSRPTTSTTSMTPGRSVLKGTISGLTPAARNALKNINPGPMSPSNLAGVFAQMFQQAGDTSGGLDMGAVQKALSQGWQQYRQQNALHVPMKKGARTPLRDLNAPASPYAKRGPSSRGGFVVKPATLRF